MRKLLHGLVPKLLIENDVLVIVPGLPRENAQDKQTRQLSIHHVHHVFTRSSRLPGIPDVRPVSTLSAVEEVGTAPMLNITMHHQILNQNLPREIGPINHKSDLLFPSLVLGVVYANNSFSGKTVQVLEQV